MSYIVIENFKFGLDTRRLDLNSRPGQLVDLVNAHIDQGGQVEKRKAFAKTDIVSSITPAVTTKGFQEGVDGIYVFGHEADPGGWPTGIKYQRLVHPPTIAAGLTPITFPNTAIDRVLFSTVFAGKIFVIVQYTDFSSSGQTYAFYDGVAVTDFYYGRKVHVAQGNDGLLADLVTAINASGVYTAVQTGMSADVYGPVGTLYSVTITKVTAAGTLTSALVDTGVPGVAGTSAIGTFQIVTGTEAAGHEISQITVGVTNLLLITGRSQVSVLYNDSPERTASDVAVAINVNSSTTGYQASASGGAVLISTVATGTSVNGAELTITSAIDVCIGLCRFNFVGTGFNLDYINVDGVNILTAVLVYPTPAGETISAFCDRIKANINANTGVSGYLSNSVSNGIFLSKAVTKGSDVEKTVSVSVTPINGTGAVFEGDVAPFLVAISPVNLLATPGTPIGREGAFAYYTTVSSAVVTPVGGVPPYTYQWIVQLFASSWNILSPNAASTSFRALLAYPTHGSTTAVCEVRDSSGLVAVSPQVSIAW